MMALIRILIIEDNAANMELMRYLLCASGYDILTAINGRVGLAAAARERPDLIICDVQMPEMNGYELAQAMNSNEQLRHIPLIAVTAFAMVGDREKALAAGFDDYISKPIDPQEFVLQIEKLLPPELRVASGNSQLQSK
jgi:CheY-like chemotaxis protein